MADWLLLRLPRVPDEPASWLVVDARGTPVGPPQSGPLTAAVTRAAGRRVWVSDPGPDVLLAEPEVPVKAGLKLQQLVPYALEEQLADNIEDLHFAIGKRASDSIRAPVAVVARALLDEWLATLRSSGIEPEAIHAESDLLPGNPAHAVVLLEEDAVFVRAPGAAPVTLPADALAEALEIAQSRGADSPGGGRGLILYAGAAEWERHSAQVEAARPRFEGIRIQLLTEGPLPVLALQDHDGALDLRLSAPDAASLDQLGQALRRNGWQADLTSGGMTGSAYEGRMQVRAGDAPGARS